MDTLMVMFGMFALVFDYWEHIRMLKGLLFVFIARDMIFFFFFFFFLQK